MDNLNVRALASEIFTINTICILKEDLLMKIIDQKGRLLGKINVIDFLAIIFFLSFVPMFYFGYKNLHKKPSDPAAQNACCCGHSKYPMTILIKAKSSGKIIDIVNGVYIPRKRNLYKRS